MGKVVICIDTNCFDLTIDKEYLVLRENVDYYYIIDDSNVTGGFYKKRFKIKDNYEVIFLDDGGLKVGCQTFKKEQIKAFIKEYEDYQGE